MGPLQDTATKSMSPDVVLAACLEVVSATLPSAPVTDATFKAFLEYIASICSGLVNDLYFDEFEWKFVAVCPYLAPFMAEEDAVNVCKNLLARCYRDAMPKEHAEDEDEDGEDLCNCEFSLGYGAKVRVHRPCAWMCLCADVPLRESSLTSNGLRPSLMRGRAADSAQQHPPASQARQAVRHLRLQRLRQVDAHARHRQRPGAERHLRVLIRFACVVIYPPDQARVADAFAAAGLDQVDGFPPKDVVKTVFVEHDIQGDLGELNLVDYVQVGPPLTASHTRMCSSLREDCH